MYRSVAWVSVHFGEDNLVEKISNIDLELLEKRGNSIEWMNAKLHDNLMSYYLYKAEDKTQ